MRLEYLAKKQIIVFVYQEPTSLFDAGVPERVIQQRTGHRSIEGLRIYERITDEQEMAVSNILTGESMRYDDCRGKKDCLDEISINTGTVVNGTNKGNVSSSSSDVKEVDQSRLGTHCNVNFYSTPASHYPPYPPSHYWSRVLSFFPRCPPVYDYCDVQYPPYYITSFPGDNKQCN